MPHSSTWSASRRGFLGGMAAFGVAGTAALSGCRSNRDGGNSGIGNNGGAPNQSIDQILPTYKVTTFVEPDLPATPEGVPNAYFSYPAVQPDSVSETPGAGGTVSFLTLTWDPVGTGGSWLQNIQDRLGATLDISSIQAADYPAKLATTIAGNDLPDVVCIRDELPRIPQALEAKFEDLTEYLSGDSVLEYPHLAAVTTGRWRQCAFNGGIYAIVAQNLIGTPTWFTNDEILNNIGVTWNPKSAVEVRELALEIKAKAKGTFPLGGANNVLNMAAAMWDLPNGWAEENGKFIASYEAEAYRDALEWTAQQWADDLMQPNSFAGFDTKAEFTTGRTVIQSDGGTAWTAHANQGMTISPWKIPAADGNGDGTRRLSGGMVAPVGISKQSSPDRVREILRILNWLSSPHGTSEHLAKTYGIEGEHFTWSDDGAPVRADAGTAQREVGLSYVCSSPYDFFVPGQDETVKKFHQDQIDTLPTGRASAANGLHSETNDTKGANLSRTISDVVNDVIQGRKTLADFDAALAAWKSGGGDTIRGELEEAYAAVQ